MFYTVMLQVSPKHMGHEWCSFKEYTVKQHSVFQYIFCDMDNKLKETLNSIQLLIQFIYS